ncbi:MAG TPA: aminomethyltransferase family protein, partial [Candidatus Polarisedimenticolia bacterium]|nr:aminomethyltransferase family protein [Candidatus Polarisedimenticolia bacterium]
VMDRSNHGRLRVSGAQRFTLLNRLTTQDLRSIAAGAGAETVLLSDKGRILDDLRLYAREEFFYLVTSPGNQEFVQSMIEKLRFRDDVTLEDVTASTAMISLFGPQSAHMLEGVARARHLDGLGLHHNVEVEISGARGIAARTADVGGGGFNLIVPAESAGRVWGALLDGGGSYGVSPLGEEGYEMLRIEYGVPRFSRELTQEYNPLEAGLGAAISWTKGCYVGQEVVARLDSRQKVGKHLVGLWLEPGPVPEAGSSLEIDGRPDQSVGKLTSVAPSLDLRRVIGLAYVRTEHAVAGVNLTVISGEDRVGAVVAELPFVAPKTATSP